MVFLCGGSLFGRGSQSWAGWACSHLAEAQAQAMPRRLAGWQFEGQATQRQKARCRLETLPGTQPAKVRVPSTLLPRPRSALPQARDQLEQDAQGYQQKMDTLADVLSGACQQGGSQGAVPVHPHAGAWRAVPACVLDCMAGVRYHTRFAAALLAAPELRYFASRFLARESDLLPDSGAIISSLAWPPCTCREGDAC